MKRAATSVSAHSSSSARRNVARLTAPTQPAISRCTFFGTGLVDARTIAPITLPAAAPDFASGLNLTRIAGDRTYPGVHGEETLPARQS